VTSGAVPEVGDTTDLLAGAEIHSGLLALLPLVGQWAGRGTVLVPATQQEQPFAQRITFSHDGRPFLSYSSHSWLLAPDGTVLRLAFRETGFWRVGLTPATDDDIEFTLASAAGIVEILTGRAGDQRWEVASGAVAITPTAKSVSGEHRLYAIMDGSLVYAQELAIEPGEFRPHLTATLARV